jgi:hypothetical protein
MTIRKEKKCFPLPGLEAKFQAVKICQSATDDF